KRFLKKYTDGQTTLSGPFVEGDNWVVETQRRFMTARDKIADSLKDDVKILQAKGIPNHIAKQIAKGFEIISESSRMAELAKEDRNFGIFMRRYFTPEKLA
ncbi:MAG TPA: hypothetical protein VJ044_07995, partial [Candidatus Hodarchaeales archaeon]|nr:hypothetical protein [Candidatus Hodarchaeales archaeon]